MKHGYDGLFAKAEKVPLDQYKGEFVTTDEYDASEMVSTHDWESLDDPPTAPDGTRYLWGTRPGRVHVDASILDAILEDHHEDARDQVSNEKLVLALAYLNEAVKDVVTYYPDLDVAVILPK